METTTDNQDFRNDLVALIIAIAVSVAFLLLTGCKRTEYVTVPQVSIERAVRVDTLLLARTDSVWLHDSIFVDRWTSGDTVFVAKEVYKYGTRWRDRIVYKARTDTLLRTDSVSVPYPVERTLTKWERRWMGIGKWACGIGVAIILLTSAIWWYRRKV